MKLNLAAATPLLATIQKFRPPYLTDHCLSDSGTMPYRFYDPYREE